MNANRRTLVLGSCAALLALALPLFSGALSSPLVVIPVMGLFLLPLVAPQRVVNRAAAVAIILLGGAELIQLDGGWPEIAAAVILASAGLVGSSVATRRDRDLRSMSARLDAIQLEADRGRTGTGEGAAVRRMDTLRELLIELTAATAANRAVLWLAQPEQRRIALRAASRGVIVGDWLPLAGTPLNWLIEAGQPVRFEARPPISAEAARVLAVPLPGREGAVPIVTLEFDPNANVPDAEAVAPAIGTFARNLAAVEERAGHEAFREQVELLIETLRRIPAAPGPEEFARDLAADVCRLVRADGAAIATWTEDAGKVLAVHGTEGGPALGAVFGPGESELALAARAATLLRRDLRERRVGPPHVIAPDEHWSHVPRHFAALPLMVDDHVTGLLAVWAGEHLDEQGVELLEILAPFAGSQLAKAVEFGRVRANAERDALTGLPNRRAFERAFEAERQRFLRYAHPVSLVIADVDHFKTVNDTHGHDAGDAVLRAFADTLAGCVRDVDTLARFGGEEFVVLLPETALDAAAEAAERLRRATEGIQVQHDGVQITVRASFGVSTCPDCVAQPDGLLRSADASLYEAKRGGRNCVRTAPRTHSATQPAGRRSS